MKLDKNLLNMYEFIVV